MWGVSLTHPILASLYAGSCLAYRVLTSFFIFYFFILSGKFLLHIPCLFLFSFFLGSSSYSSRAGFIFIWGVSLTHPELGLVLSTDLLLHIRCWFYIYRGSFSYTSRAGLIFIWEFLLHIPRWLHFYAGSLLYIPCFHFHIPCCFHFYAGSFSYTSHAGFIFRWGVSLTHPMTASFSNPGSFSYTSRAVFFYICAISLKHPLLLHFYLVSFSYTSGEFLFLLHIPC